MSNLVLFDAARDALAECKSVDEAKGWADRAAATQAYARMAKDKSLEVDAAEIRIRAERRLGEMLAEQKASGNMAKGHKFAGGSSKEPPAITLAEVGVDKKLSARAQRLAAVPPKEFEAEVVEWRGRVQAEGERVSARLEAAGARHIGNTNADATELQEDDRLDDMARDFEAMARVVEADDKLAAAWAEVKAANERYEQLERLYQSQRSELAAMTKEAARWMRRAEALEKRMKGGGA